MNRREFICLLAGAPATSPRLAHAAPHGIPTIGFLCSADRSAWAPWVAAFLQRLHELGWKEGSNVAILYRWADGKSDRAIEIADEYVRLKVDAIVTAGGSLLPLMRATSIIPIVFAIANDPVGAGYVASLTHPGGNITGFSLQTTDAARKRLELLRDMASSLHRVAILANSGNPAATFEIGEARAAADALGIAVIILDVSRPEEIAPTLHNLGGRADALYVCTDPFFTANRVQIADLALEAKLPTVYGFRDHVEAGGLISYGPNVPDLFRRAADYVDKILRGIKPGDLPVQQPIKFDLVVNQRTAKALGLSVPPRLLLLADETIE